MLAEDGDYVITVTTYRPGETGDYRLSLAPSAGHPRQIGVPGGPRVIALLVGVSDYGGRTSNLPNTDADARELYDGLRTAGLLHPACAVLTNEQATTKAVAEAFARAAAAGRARTTPSCSSSPAMATRSTSAPARPSWTAAPRRSSFTTPR